MTWWQAATDWQTALDGWIGAVLGALASIGVAVWVLRRTLKTEHARFERQQQAERERFREQQRADREQFERQVGAAREQAAEQFRLEQELVLEQHRLEAWGDLVTAMREFLHSPIERDELKVLERAATAAYFRWQLYTPSEMDEVADGVKRVVSTAIGHARKRAQEVRHQNSTLQPPYQASTAISQEASSYIVDLTEHGSALLRGTDAEREAAKEWFIAHV